MPPTPLSGKDGKDAYEVTLALDGLLFDRDPLDMLPLIRRFIHTRHTFAYLQHLAAQGGCEKSIATDGSFSSRVNPPNWISVRGETADHCLRFVDILIISNVKVPDAKVIGINAINTSAAVLPVPSNEPANSGPAIVPRRPAATAAPTPVFRMDGG